MLKNSLSTIYPLTALRTLALHTQHLTTPSASSQIPITDAITDLITSLGYLQIDTLSVVNRAHYVTLWSRLGSYRLQDLDHLLYRDGERRLYEGWGHAASIIPLTHYRYHRWRTDPHYSFNPTFRQWLSQDGNRAIVDQTLERIRSEGGLRVGHFKRDDQQRGAWYDWSPPKMALEVLFAWGDLMVADRVNFQRVYDLKERVLPAWVETAPIPPAEARRFCLEQAAKSLGVFDPAHLTLYAYMRATPVRSEIKTLVKDGTLIEIQGESITGIKKWLIHRDHLPLLQRAADGDLKAERTTFLSPFDSLFWAGDRDQHLWGFKQVLECYKRPHERIYGYFCLPILYHDCLIGRFDPKLDRKSGRLQINALYLEAGIEPDDTLISAIAHTMRDFLTWHGATSLHIDRSVPIAFGEKLNKAL